MAERRLQPPADLETLSGYLVDVASTSTDKLAVSLFLSHTHTDREYWIHSLA